jgi:hypothetical protein
MAAAVAGAWLLAMPAGAGAVKGDLYWANTAGGTLTGTIGHAKLDGSHANNAYVSTFDVPCGVAADRKHLWWADASGTTVGRVSLSDRRHPHGAFLTGASSPCGVGVGGGKVYTANQGHPNALLFGSLRGGKLKKAHSDEPTDNSTVSDDDCGVATDSRHVYWINSAYDNNAHVPFYDVKRMGLGANPGKPVRVAGRQTYDACGLDVAGGYLYVTESSLGFNAINRFPLTAKPETPYHYIEPSDGIGYPCDIAVAGNHIYWADADLNSIGRANLDGTHVKPTFITGASVPCGIAAVTR